MKLKDTIPAAVPQLIRDYLDGTSDLEPFCSFRPTLRGLKEAASERSFSDQHRGTLVEVLQEQAHQSDFANAHTFAQIEQIAQAQTVTVTTGHQLCVYGGPLFFFYKILSVVKMAQELRSEGIEAVPVFWMASEDHDFDEINHIYLNGEKVAWGRTATGPVGKLKMEDFADFRSHVHAAFAHDDRYAPSLKTLDRIFSEERTLAQAIRDLAYWAFADLGVVVLDADDYRLKRLFAPQLKLELEKSFSLEALEAQSQQLEALGHSIQVNGREINLFWMEDDYRERIVRDDHGFATADGVHRWERGELLNLVESHPQRFSPNVVLRPLFQEVILPNIAYVGGPGELSYWLQLKGVFDAVQVSFPAIVLRDMFALTNDGIEKRIEQLGIGYQDILRPLEEVFTELVRSEGTNEQLVEEVGGQFAQRMDELVKQLAEIDPNMERSAKAERQRIANRLETLGKKVLRSDKQRHEVIRQRLQYIHKHLRPGGTPQERVHNWLQYAADPSVFSARAVLLCNPFSPDLRIVLSD